MAGGWGQPSSSGRWEWLIHVPASRSSGGVPERMKCPRPPVMLNPSFTQPSLSHFTNSLVLPVTQTSGLRPCPGLGVYFGGDRNSDKYANEIWFTTYT